MYIDFLFRLGEGEHEVQIQLQEERERSKQMMKLKNDYEQTIKELEEKLGKEQQVYFLFYILTS